MELIEIPRRFCGPPNSGNGGYVCGRVAHGLSGPVSVTLHKPPPLERPMELRTEAGQRRLYDGGDLVAEAAASTLNLTVPRAPSAQLLAAKQSSFEGFEKHSYPGCFVCGPARREGDGMRVFVTRCSENLVAAPWVPDESLATDGFVDPAFIWAAMDCPGFWSLRNKPTQHVLLGRLTAEILNPLRPGSACTIIAWECAQQGRKARVGSAVYTDDGSLVGRAEGVWITLKAPLRQALNLRSGWPADLSEERFDQLIEHPHCRIERIVSLGQATPAGQWLVQDESEFVLLYSGHAKLIFEGDASAFDMYPGDYIEIPGGQRHRVEWTDSTEPTVWLAVHH